MPISAHTLTGSPSRTASDDAKPILWRGGASAGAAPTLVVNPGGVALSEEAVLERMRKIQGMVGQPTPELVDDPEPSLVGEGLYVGNKFHAMDVDVIKRLGVSAVLNCASMGIRGLPLDAYEEAGIEYNHTNVKRDEVTYPILHQPDGERSDHLKKAAAVYDKVRAAGGTALFFCVAGQNRSATLAVAVQMLRGVSLDGILAQCSTTRPFIVENKGFQRQLVELEGKLVPPAPRGAQAHRFGSELMPKRPRLDESPVDDDDDGEEKEGHVLCELFVPGVGPINLWLPSQCSIDTARWYLITAVDHELEKEGKRSGMAWLIFSTFGANLPEGFNLVLEDAAVERHVQLARLRDAFGLELVGDDPLAADCEVRWTGACRFEVILFTFFWRPPPADDAAASAAAAWSGRHDEREQPFTFRHAERATARGTLLEHAGVDPYVRAWDFSSGEPFRSTESIVFSFSPDGAKSKRDFMEISVAARARQQFDAPGDHAGGFGAILGMGNNAIVHKLELAIVDPAPPPAAAQSSDDLAALAAAAPMRSINAPGSMNGSGRHSWPGNLSEAGAEGARLSPSPSPLGGGSGAERFKRVVETVVKRGRSNRGEGRHWEAAVKRAFSVQKMAGMLNPNSEVEVAKRLKRVSALNRQGRLLSFYGLGVLVSSHIADRHEYRFELSLLSQYNKEFSAYTLSRFLEDFILEKRRRDLLAPEKKATVEKLQDEFSLMHVKVLLVSLLSGFRDLTLMGVQSFDFNHPNNVLISKDYKTARLIDIDGDSKGSIQKIDAAGRYVALEAPTDDTADAADASSHFAPRRHSSHQPAASSAKKPALNVDLRTLLPRILETLLLGKGRGQQFVSEQKSKIWNAKSEDAARVILSRILRENYFPALRAADDPPPPGTAAPAAAEGSGSSSGGGVGRHNSSSGSSASAHMANTLKKLVEWYLDVLFCARRPSPWENWTQDVYDCMRCVDHLPIA